MSWPQYFYRRIFPGVRSPVKVLAASAHPFGTVPQSPPGIRITRATPAFVNQQVQFLSQYFQSSQEPVRLVIPPIVLRKGLEEGHWIGAEIRSNKGELIGCAFSLFCGQMDENAAGLVTWFCIRPDFRKQGLGSYLLAALQQYAWPRQIHGWRNDGWMKSPTPPLWHESRIVRRIQKVRSNLAAQKSIFVSRSSLDSWRTDLLTQWKEKQPHGIILDDPTKPSLCQVWEAKFSPTVTIALFLQPTFEVDRMTGEPWCEIVGWAWRGTPQTEQEMSHRIEAILDRLPQGAFEAPASMPHFESAWKEASPSLWSWIGLDQGSPVLRPILPLCMA